MTDWSYIARAWSAESPASTMSAVNTSAPDDGHADREDHEPHGRRRERGERDPDRDAAAHQRRCHADALPDERLWSASRVLGSAIWARDHVTVTECIRSGASPSVRAAR